MSDLAIGIVVFLVLIVMAVAYVEIRWTAPPYKHEPMTEEELWEAFEGDPNAEMWN